MKIINKALTKVYKKDIKNGTIEITKEVNTIRSFVFSNMDISYIVIPNTVDIIEFAAFSNCKNVTEIIIQNPKCIIGQSTFAYCQNLKYIELPNNLKFLSAFTFRTNEQESSVFQIPR